MKSTAKTICFSLLSFTAATLSAATTATPALRPVTSAWTLEAGTAQVTDTYLSPLRYNGQSAAVGMERWQAMRFDPHRWVMQLRVRGQLDRTLNPARNSVMWGLGLEGHWAMMWRSSIAAAPGLTLGIGPDADLRVGALYQRRNGNNPVQAELALTAGVSAYATYSMHWGRLPVTLRWQPSVPLLGAFFCPDYGELYYEIGLGNTDQLLHMAWPGSYRRLESLLTLDMRFGATALRLGYRADALSARANNITHRAITHTLMVGVSMEWLSINPRKPLSTEAVTISAYY